MELVSSEIARFILRYGLLETGCMLAQIAHSDENFLVHQFYLEHFLFRGSKLSAEDQHYKENLVAGFPFRN